MTHPDRRQMQAKRARSLLDLLGLDVHRRGRQPDRGRANAVVGPAGNRQGWQVRIDLEAFDALVAPVLRAAIDAETEKAKR